jgi:hypothetical protein
MPPPVITHHLYIMYSSSIPQFCLFIFEGVHIISRKRLRMGGKNGGKNGKMEEGKMMMSGKLGGRQTSVCPKEQILSPSSSVGKIEKGENCQKIGLPLPRTNQLNGGKD